MGDRYVFESMSENGAPAGGEQSGHIIFGNIANTGDGVLTAIKLMQAIATREVPPSAGGAENLPQVLEEPEGRIKDAAMDDLAVRHCSSEAAEKKLRRRLRCCAKRTGALVRVMAEAATQEACQVDSIVAVIAAQGHLPEDSHA